jgi:hypothetical protein
MLDAWRMPRGGASMQYTVAREELASLLHGGQNGTLYHQEHNTIGLVRSGREAVGIDQDILESRQSCFHLSYSLSFWAE